MMTPSRTGQSVALMRAGLTRPSTPQGDPDAQRKLCAGMEPAPTSRPDVFLPYLTERTRFVDDRVLAAIRAGLTQVVILGAGYDDRALRFASPGVQYFEIDHPATQADKRARLAALDSGAAATLAPGDFGRDRIEDVLTEAGHYPDAATLFICEGLLIYLPQDSVRALLTGLSGRAAPGSELVATLSVAPIVPRPNWPAAEPRLTAMPAAEYLDFVRDCGWTPEQAVDVGNRGRALLLAARPR